MIKNIIGVVVSNKMQKTVVVKAETKVKHPLYKKLIKKTRTYKAHDELGLKPGQKVKIGESKKYSKDVHFKVVEVIS
jgi:small subunit ribosomal protein S17